MNAAETVLLAGAALAAYAVFVLLRPQGRCLRCRGKGYLHQPKRKRARPCPACKGRRIARRPGATFVHRQFWSLFGDRIQEKQRTRLRGKDIS